MFFANQLDRYFGQTPMLAKLFPILTLLLALVVIVLTVTSVPALASDHLGGTMLMAHMAASGALVFGLPVLAWVGLNKVTQRRASGSAERIGFWAVLLTGWLSIATVFACMLPVFGTDAMHHLIELHGYAGFAMVPATVLLLVGVIFFRKAPKRSSNPG